LFKNIEFFKNLRHSPLAQTCRTCLDMFLFSVELLMNLWTGFYALVFTSFLHGFARIR